jgi:DNA-binding LytR/AlgR family response regulator
LKNFTFVIIDDNHNNGLKTRAVAGSFQNLTFLASASSYDEGIDCVLEHVPDIVFLEIDPQDKDSNLSLHLINELHRYLTVVPKIIVTTKNDSLCLNAFKYGVFDYFIHPMETKELRKTLFRLDKELGNKSVSFPSQIKSDATEIPVIEDVITSNEENQETLEIDLVLDEVIENEFVEDVIESQNTIADDKEVTFLQTQNTPEKPLIICVKSYGDYRYIEAKDICYLQADNNSTDIHLNSGEMITAFKTLKHFEGVMTYPFVRIHNSYIANVDYISRIHTGNAVCHIKNTTTKLPFSKSYKENVDAIITTIASGNYLEI